MRRPIRPSRSSEDLKLRWHHFYCLAEILQSHQIEAKVEAIEVVSGDSS